MITLITRVLLQLTPPTHPNLPSCSPLQTAASADVLSEAILEELLEDTARTLQAVRTDRQAEEQARALLQAPTLETMLQRMEEMEVRKAATVSVPTERATLTLLLSFTKLEFFFSLKQLHVFSL